MDTIVGSVTAKIDFHNGYSKKLTVTIEDNCCVEHANAAAQNIVKLYVDNLIETERYYGNSEFAVSYVILDFAC